MSAVPCPPWCMGDQGHPFDSLTHDGRPVRTHYKRVAQFADDCLVEVVADEIRYGEKTEFGMPLIVLGNIELMASQARQAAAALLNAADALDEMTGAASGGRREV